MARRLGISGILICVLVFAASFANAADNRSIQGVMINENGKAIVGAEIRAKRLDAKAKILLAKTNNRGVYVFESLPAGLYEVTAYLNGHPQSRAKVQTRAKGWAKVDFDLRLNLEDASEADRMQRDIQNSAGTSLGN